tara:strand:- start:736 stop:1344 length:609 start_codon:yes stop_codon:yes gene_type:complete
MAYINLIGDSDGDLHTAALHNAKFGAIASVLNGNVDSDNLKYPNSIVSFAFNASINTDWYHIVSTSVSTITALAASATNGHVNLMRSSIIKLPFAATLQDVQIMSVDGSAYSADDCRVAFQKSSSALTGYTDMMWKAEDFTSGSTSVFNSFSLSGASGGNTVSSSVTANQFVRLIVTNSAGGNAVIPPPMTAHVVLKVAHVN